MNPSKPEPTRLGLREELPDELRWQLRALRQPQAPGRDLWPDIATRLANTPQQSRHSHEWRRWRVPASLAASVLVAVAALVLVRPVALDSGTASAPAPAQTAAPVHSPTAAPTLVQVEAAGMTRQYQAAVAEIAMVPPSPVLQPAIEELDHSAALIRAALERDPDSRLLLQQLRRTYTRRLSLVQRMT